MSTYVPQSPRRLHLELTNRCNSLCATCLRTHAPEPERDMTVGEVEEIVSGLPQLESVALQVNGEPLLHPELPRVLALMAERGLDAELNTNGLALRGERIGWLLEHPPARLHVSVDAATRLTYVRVRGVDAFDRLVGNLRAFLEARGPAPAAPRVLLWMTAGRHNLAELPGLVQLAADVGAEGVYLQRLVLTGAGMARPADSLHGTMHAMEREIIARAERLAADVGVSLHTCGGHAPGDMLEAASDPEPWRQCRRPFESAVVLADGDVVPCCISTFVAPRKKLRLGNVLSDSWDEVWNGDAYDRLRVSLREGDGPSWCQGCGTRWSL